MAQAMPMISLAPSSNTLGFSEVFTVDVFVSGIEAIDPLLAFGFNVGTQPGLAFDSATVASPFLDDSGFFPTTDVAGSTIPSIFGDDILLATLSLVTGTTAGLLDVSIFTMPANFGFAEGLFTLSNNFNIDEISTIEVIGVAPIPLPSTLLLIVLGLCGIRLRNARCE